MPPTKICLSTKNLGKKFCRNLRWRILYGLQDLYTSTHDSKSLRPREFWCFQNLNMTLAEGESLGVVGPNGAGKSTLLKILARIIPPSVGEVISESDLSSCLSVSGALQNHLTGYENIALFSKLLPATAMNRKEREEWISDFCELRGVLAEPVKGFSTGMYLRLWLGILLSSDSKLFLFDEIVTSLDLGFRKKILIASHHLKKSGASFVVTSHDERWIEEFCDRTFQMPSKVEL